MNACRGWLIGLVVMVGLWAAFLLAVRFLIPGPPDLPPDSFELPPVWLVLMLVAAALYKVGFAVAVAIHLIVAAVDRHANRRTPGPG